MQRVQAKFVGEELQATLANGAAISYRFSKAGHLEFLYSRSDRDWIAGVLSKQEAAKPLVRLPRVLKGRSFYRTTWREFSDSFEIEIENQDDISRGTGRFSWYSVSPGRAEARCAEATKVPLIGRYDSDSLRLRVKMSEKSELCGDFAWGFVRGTDHLFTWQAASGPEHMYLDAAE